MINLEKCVAGKQVKHPTGYTYFMPNVVNDSWIWEDQSINKLLEKAEIGKNRCNRPRKNGIQ